MENQKQMNELDMPDEKQMSDLDLLYDYKKDLTYAAMCYTTMATDAHHDFLRDQFLIIAASSVTSQEKAADLIAQLGGIA